MFGVSRNFKMHVLRVLRCKKTNAKQDHLLAPMIDSCWFHILTRRSQREIRRTASEQKRTNLTLEISDTYRNISEVYTASVRKKCLWYFEVGAQWLVLCCGSRMTNAIQLWIIVPLHCIALHCIALPCIILHCISLHCLAEHCMALHFIALHYLTLHRIALHYIALHFIALHCIA
jgi:hypothetical protein